MWSDDGTFNMINNQNKNKFVYKNLQKKLLAEEEGNPFGIQDYRRNYLIM